MDIRSQPVHRKHATDSPPSHSAIFSFTRNSSSSAQQREANSFPLRSISELSSPPPGDNEGLEENRRSLIIRSCCELMVRVGETIFECDIDFGEQTNRIELLRSRARASSPAEMSEGSELDAVRW